MPHACSSISRLAFHPEYAAIGSVTNLASRLCDEAKAGQIVVSRGVYGMVEQWSKPPRSTI
jgi:class 3 adenylate cyclase